MKYVVTPKFKRAFGVGVEFLFHVWVLYYRNCIHGNPTKPTHAYFIFSNSREVRLYFQHLYVVIFDFNIIISFKVILD